MRFITYLSVVGVALGVAALLLTLAIVRGFSKEISNKIYAFEAHVQVTSWRDQPLTDVQQLVQEWKRLPHVEQVSALLMDYALLKAPGDANIEGMLIRGVDHPPPALVKTIRQGTFRFTPNSEGLPGMVIGMGLAQQMKLKLGDRVTIFSKPPDDAVLSDSAASAEIPIHQFHIAGIYDSGMREFETAFVFTDIQDAQKLFNVPGFGASRIDLWLDSPDEAYSVTEVLEKTYGLASRHQYPLQIQTVFQAQEGLFAWTRLQEQIIPLLIGVIVIVAAFNLVSMLLMLILEKTGDIGILQSMGATPKSIRRLFLTLGLLIGVTGSVLGMVLAWILAMLQLEFQLIPLPVEAYFLETAPISLRGFDFVIVPFFALLLCALASWLPARFAAKVDPIKTIRFKG